METKREPEPWLRGTFTDNPAVCRAVLHALELAKEDLALWCGNLTDEEVNARPGGIAPIAFHLRHIAGSIDRLLTYAEGEALNSKQIEALQAELSPPGRKDDLFAELCRALDESGSRIRRLGALNLEVVRQVGKKQLPTTLGGLLVHIAEHTQATRRTSDYHSEDSHQSAATLIRL